MQTDEVKKKRGFGLVWIAVLIVAALLGTAGWFSYTRYFRPESIYREAVALMEQEKYTEAAELFSGLNGYKDSDAGLASCRYNHAIRLVEEKKYAEAKAIFADMNGYLNSGEWLENIPVHEYNEAVARMEAGDYRGAAELFADTVGRGSTEEYLEVCREQIALEDAYGEALSLKEAGKFDEAIDGFKALGEYRDAPDQIDACIYAGKDVSYERALGQLNAGNIIEGYETMVRLKGHRDSAEKEEQFRELYRTEKLNVGNVTEDGTLFFGLYEQDNDETNGPEPIEWIVLEIKGDEALLISRCGLDFQQYAARRKKMTWSNSDIRTWLNKAFLQAAFSDAEQELILKKKVYADHNPRYSWPKPGSPSNDRVFLLSITEANRIFVPYTRRPCPATAYAASKGRCYDTGAEDGTLYCSWWLRTPGEEQDTASYVDMFGTISQEGGIVSSAFAVRPAIRIRLGSGQAE